MSPEFLITALVVVLVPGTGVIYTLSMALLQGGRAAVAAATGCTLGILPHLAASILGVAALLHASALAFQAVKIAGVLYLLYLAWGLWRERGALAAPEAAGAPARGLARVAVRGLLINILNPKLSIFFLAFLPQFVPAEAATALPALLVMSGVFMLMTFVVFVFYGLLAATVRDHVTGSPRVMTWLRRAFAGVFAGLAGRLALAEA